MRGPTVIILLLEIHVNNAAGPDSRHLRTKESTDILEQTGLLVASVFREEGRDIVRGEILGPLRIARSLVRALATPFVDVQTEEVDTILIVAAVKVSRDILPDRRGIVGGVTDVEGPLGGVGRVGFHIPNSSLDERACRGVVGLVGDFVAGKKSEGIGVLGQGIDDGGITPEEVDVPLRIFSGNRLGGAGQVGEDVDARVGQVVHAGIVVGGGIDRVDPNKVGLELFEDGDITGATGGIAQGVRGIHG